MIKSASDICERVLEDGFAVAGGIFPPEKCASYVEKFEDLLSRRFDEDQNIGNESSQVVRNYFLDIPEAMEFFDNDLADQVMRILIDDDYTLTSSSARNKQIRNEFSNPDITGGVGWHTDGRYLRGQLINPSLTYYCVYLLQDFTEQNGATHYVPGSSKWTQRVPRDAEFDYKIFEAPAGSVLFFDSGIVHRAGPAGSLPRWGVWSLFSPWFIKPYNDFVSFYSADEVEHFSPRLRQLFHISSQPPKRGEDHNLATLERVRQAPY